MKATLHPGWIKAGPLAFSAAGFVLFFSPLSSLVHTKEFGRLLLAPSCSLPPDETFVVSQRAAITQTPVHLPSQTASPNRPLNHLPGHPPLIRHQTAHHMPGMGVSTNTKTRSRHYHYPAEVHGLVGVETPLCDRQNHSIRS